MPYIYDENRGVFDWVHVQEISTVIDVDSVAYQLSNDPMHPGMKVTSEDLTTSHPWPEHEWKDGRIFGISADSSGNTGGGGGGHIDPSTQCVVTDVYGYINSDEPDADGDGRLSAMEAAAVIEKLIDPKTGELKEDVVTNNWTTL